jgi:hypothetical protein
VSADGEFHQGESLSRAVTPTGRRPGTSAAERKRQQRERERGLVYETADWQLFIDLATLSQKAGCQPRDLRKVVLKELVDNALDAGAEVSLTYTGTTWTVSDNGPGVDPAEVPLLFAVNRPLRSSKLRRLPLRGMLGNGLRVVAGAVAATDGSLVVETRGRRLALAICRQTGQTVTVSDEPAPQRPGMVVQVSIGPGSQADGSLARASIAAAKCGKAYGGPSSPWWYGAKDLQRLFERVTPADTTVRAVCRSLGLDLDDDRAARDLGPDDAAAVLERLRACAKPVAPERLGFIGEQYRPEWPGYARATGTMTTQAGARIPFIVEAWATCARSAQKGQGTADIELLINRSMTVATIHASFHPDGLYVRGCGLGRWAKVPKTGDYAVTLSVIAPHIQLATDGKEPALAPFSEAIAGALSEACRAAYRAMSRPDRGVSIKDAAWSVMEDAYRIASGDGRFPANARQIMYAARPAILRLTGKNELGDKYFTQTLLPDYLNQHEKQTAAWDVVFDARGTFIEPHTGHEVPLGTIAVRDYLRERPDLGAAVGVDRGGFYPTRGPEHRYTTVLFIEKEGFGPLLKAARIAERYDVAIMSTKGMSVTAARRLLDRLARRGVRVLVLHDFDVAGFSIFGTLGGDSRRYRFDNSISLEDAGLRLSDVRVMRLEPEPVVTDGDWAKRAATLAGHGANPQEIAFLRTQRVELNAMPAPVFIRFVESVLDYFGVEKVVPDPDILEHHARRVIEQGLVERLLRENQERLKAEAAAAALPADLDDQVTAILEHKPEMSWDRAVAAVVRGEVAA